MRTFRIFMARDDVLECTIVIEVPIDRQHRATLDTNMLQDGFSPMARMAAY
ncbi:MAG: hypothetical protein JO233_04810 [Candidatus Eremiobacteraeota bacterium]|nr:hypothetical protein [Candidatus Eremiobacteraeota bacterium]